MCYLEAVCSALCILYTLPSALTDAVPQVDDVIYAEVKTTGSVHSPTVSQSGPAVPQDNDVIYAEVKTTGSVHSPTVSRSGPAVPRDDDVTYSEVKTTGSVQSPTVSRSGPAENPGPVSHPYRLAAVCLGLLCVLLLTAIIALCVHYDSTFSSVAQKQSDLSQNLSLIERDMEQLQQNCSVLTEEKAKLQESYTALFNRNDQLQKDYSMLINTNEELHREKDRLQTQIVDFCTVLSERSPSLNPYCRCSSEERVCEPCPHGWRQHGSKCYYFSNDEKSWTDSRIDCLKRGADLVIIESRDEQEFISEHRTGYSYWIGLQKRGYTWLWVDETPLTESFWKNGEPSPYWTFVYLDTVMKKWGVSYGYRSIHWICEIETSLSTF